MNTCEFSDQPALIAAALNGNEAAARHIQTQENQRRMIAMLLQRGASPSEAEEIAGDIWSEALQSWNGKSALLERFDGKGDIVAFLGRCALNRLIDLKRRARFRGDLPEMRQGGEVASPQDRFDMVEGESGSFGEVDDALVELLRDSLVKAMAQASPQALLMVKLVTLHDIQQKTIADMWGWSRSKVSRAMTAAVEQLRNDTLAAVSEVDPWLEIEWGDIVSLCSQSSEFLR